ncbi:hypothetical protein BJ875DRAFT_438507 [Amylocarpus encephaloides]|uniref:Meiotically up-regulated protein Msb1/Mug8 domain-containing protein n=1 Tax=Amylocarpus encephaloides TaxID=45428 RepID=A0A9P7YQ47_9HELO|nr:hypothetical protein BJ875DRAFT_438507 [Amylocarpus encephaloides]
MGLFSRKKNKDGPSKVNKKKGFPAQEVDVAPPKPRWEDAWTRTTVEPEEVQELLRGCTLELKSRALDVPLLLLPFRPTSDPSAARNFIRHFFDRSVPLYGEALAHELRLTEPMVLCSVVKWCWSRLPGGVVRQETYDTFQAGEVDSGMARDSFATFIPLLETEARTKIIFDFFDLLSAIAAHSKVNGFGGRKLSRLAGWWIFEHHDGANGFEGGYKGWAAYHDPAQSLHDAASHMFFGYLRSLSPGSVQGLNGISNLPMSLQKLVQETEYPPQRPDLLQTSTTKVVMIVDSVSPTPFALLRRANHFQYRDDDRALQDFAEYEDPVMALTDECRRVLKSISSANASQASSSKQSTGLRDASWSRFEDLGFSGGMDEENEDDDESSFLKKSRQQGGLRTTPHPRNMGLARPTTPSWADFLSAGFVDEAQNGPAPLLLPPDKILPPINTRGHSSQSHAPRLESNKNLEPGELASINRFDLDDSFWWVWITSLAGEETPARKSAFGRCALIETVIRNGRWLVMEEMVKGAAPEPEEGAYIAEKKSFWGRSRKTKAARRKSTGKESLDQIPGLRPPMMNQSQGVSTSSIGPDQHARIQAAAIQLQQRQRQMEAEQHKGGRRGRNDIDMTSQKTSSVFTLQPVIVSEASPAMKWANKYDKDAIREAYLKNSHHGRGLADATVHRNGPSTKSDDTLRATQNATPLGERELPAVPTSSQGPAVPLKTRTPSPDASFPPTPRAHDEESMPPPRQPEIALPTVSQSAFGNSASVDASPAPSPEPRMEASMDLARPSEDHSGSSPESKKHNKLKKKDVGTGNGGFRKIFGRKNRDSTVPESMPPSVSQNGNKAGLAPPASGGLGRRLSNLRKKPVAAAPPAQPSPVSRPISEDEVTPVATPHEAHERSYNPSVQESLSRVDTNDAHEAQQAFSSFDQGPLEDVPAFVPEDSPRQSEDSAAPPPISMSRASEDHGSSLTKEVSPPHDRWAQIRKNAADRAAASRQSGEQSRGGYSQKTDGDDGETSGEETIESRVARIKARVAELTGNMEGNGSPTSRSPVVSPVSSRR